MDNLEFRKRIKEYRNNFHLTQQDVAELVGWDQPVYSAMELGKRNIDLDKINLIAKIYGLQTWEFVRPETPIPQIEKLPSRTRKIVAIRLKIGKKPRNTEIQLSKQVKIVLLSGQLPIEFTSAEILNLFPENIKSTELQKGITDNLKRGSVRKLIVDTGRKRGREKLYRLK